MLSTSNLVNVVLYAFGKYLLVMFIFLCVAVAFHETGHILFARYHRLDYRILFEKGNLSIKADWNRLGNKKIYGHVLGIIFGLPPVILGGFLYPTPIFLLLYLVACYDDFSAVAYELSNLKKIFGFLLL
ncbi:Uncharacterised protein [uncultured archaeon]|nr:Uncharacterised protein [uncultured archaeon]